MAKAILEIIKKDVSGVNVSFKVCIHFVCHFPSFLPLLVSRSFFFHARRGDAS